MKVPTPDKSSMRVRALLYSGLVCPGLGQLTLNRRKRGWFYIGATLLVISVLFIKIFIIANQVMSGMFMAEPGTFDLSVTALKQAFSIIRTKAYTETWQILAVLPALWLGSLLDILLIGGLEEEGPRAGQGE